MTKLEDAARVGLLRVTPQSETDQCGQHVRAMFERADLTETMEAKATRGELLHLFGSGDRPDFVIDDRADAGILYPSEARPLGAVVATVALPPDLHMRDEIAFTLGVVKRDGCERPSAERFVDHMVGAAG